MVTLSYGDLNVDRMFKMSTKLSLKKRMAAVWMVIFQFNAVIQNTLKIIPHM
jgi:hypothetical protein